MPGRQVETVGTVGDFVYYEVYVYVQTRLVAFAVVSDSRPEMQKCLDLHWCQWWVSLSVKWGENYVHDKIRGP